MTTPSQESMRLYAILILSCLLAIQNARAGEIPLRIAGLVVRAELSTTAEQREQGLMHRTRLCENCGMLFVFPRAQRYGFWMKNTALPLSIAFIAANGSIINTDEMEPNTTVVHFAASDAQYALEMNRNWFTANHIGKNGKVTGLPPAAIATE